MTERFLALHLPSFATDRLRRAAPALPPNRPLATWAGFGTRRLLVAVDAAAASAGLRPGQALADAQAIAPDLTLQPADPAGDAQALQALALWARRYTPLTAVDSPDGLLLDITGCAHLLGDEDALLRDALARLGRAGIAARGAIAGALATSAALARARGDNPIVISGIEAAVAGPLPLGPALRLPLPLLDKLQHLGLRCVHHLLELPRAPLARRFGQDLLDRLDAVTGRRRVVLQPVTPPPELTVAQNLLEPITTRASIEAVLARLLDGFCRGLRQAELGARSIALVVWRMDGMVQEVAIGTGMPVREPGHLRRLFAEGLRQLEPDLGFERMALEARATDRMAAGTQTGLGLSRHKDDATAAQDLAQLLDRLGQRLRVRRIDPVASHWPEHAVAVRDLHGMAPAIPSGWATQPWPVLLLRQPRPVEVVSSGRTEALALLHWHGGRHVIQRIEGPQRLEPEWWRPRPGLYRRDYYQIELASGVRLWICRSGPPETPGWLLHGHLP